jgi:putative ABC transport system substrate-binding protein
MQKRAFITLLGGAVMWPLASRAQQPVLPVVGFLHGGSAAVFAQQAAAFQDGLRGAGFVEGRNVTIEYRWAEGGFEKLPALAGELVRRRVNVIAAIGGDIVARAAMKATSAIPIVFMVGQDVIRSGLVVSLNRPGGNVTGVTLFVSVLVPKQMELRLLNATTPDQIDACFVTAANQRISALLVSGDVFLTSRREQIIALAARHGIAAIYAFRENVAAGGLMSYGNSLNDTVGLAAVYAARLLRGENPADLPVIQPTKFEFVLNLKTAKSLGLEFPAKVLALADEAIE